VVFLVCSGAVRVVFKGVMMINLILDKFNQTGNWRSEFDKVLLASGQGMLGDGDIVCSKVVGNKLVLVIVGDEKTEFNVQQVFLDMSIFEASDPLYAAKLNAIERDIDFHEMRLRSLEKAVRNCKSELEDLAYSRLRLIQGDDKV
jgi:hypothetical protein